MPCVDNTNVGKWLELGHEYQVRVTNGNIGKIGLNRYEWIASRFELISPDQTQHTAPSSRNSNDPSQEYDAGYQHGESSLAADWESALDGLLPAAKATPTQVADHIEALQAKSVTKCDIIRASEVTTEHFILREMDGAFHGVRSCLERMLDGYVDITFDCCSLAWAVPGRHLVAVRPKPPERMKLTAAEVLAGHWDIYSEGSNPRTGQPSGCICGQEYELGRDIHAHQLALLRDAGLLVEQS